MLLTITTNDRPATDLGYLLHKHPDQCQRFDLSFGKAHFFYTEVGEDRCCACLQVATRGGNVRVRMKGDRVMQGGQAVTVMKGSLV